MPTNWQVQELTEHPETQRVKYYSRASGDVRREFFDVYDPTQYGDAERLAELLNEREALLDIVEDVKALLTSDLVEHVVQNYKLEITYQIEENGGDWEDPDMIPDSPDYAESVRVYTADLKKLSELQRAMAALVERINNV